MASLIICVVALLEQLFVLISPTHTISLWPGPNNALYNNHVLHFLDTRGYHWILCNTVLRQCYGQLQRQLSAALSSAARQPQVLRTDVNPMMRENQSRGEAHAGANVIPIKCIRSSTFLHLGAKKKERKKGKKKSEEENPPSTASIRSPKCRIARHASEVFPKGK